MTAVPVDRSDASGGSIFSKKMQARETPPDRRPILETTRFRAVGGWSISLHGHRLSSLYRSHRMALEG